ncbi:MAG: CRTAC1 family protein [Chloroflexi bacterium]|nr:CRTAC1 family protein [Chloroflexota bacterium]
MNARRLLGPTMFLAVALAAACGQPPEATPAPTPEPTAVPTPVPTVAVPTPTPEPPDDRPLADVSHLLDFVREGIYKNSDGVGGAAWLDYDDDGFLDLYITNTREAKNALFHNNGDGTFTNLAEQAGVTSETGNTAVVAGDIDNDGCTDLILAGDGAFQGNDPSGFRVYVNNCDGAFIDISETAGIDKPEVSWSLALGDVNNDGYLDLYAAGLVATGLSFDDRDRLYLNNGDRTFTDVTDDAGIEGELATCSSRFSDYNRDGWTDIFIANCFFQGVRTELLRNNGDGTFTDVAFETGLAFSPSGHPQDYDDDSRMALAIGDYDLDGDLDIFAPGRTDKPMFENNGDGTYTAIEERVSGLVSGEFGASLAVSLADFDNDRYPDAFYIDVLENSSPLGTLRVNRADGSFSEPVVFEVIFPGGAATGDYDNDGFVDLVVITSKSSSASGEPLLLHNRGGENAWITVRTVGIESNRDGVGALVTAHAGEHALIQEVSAGSGLSTNSPWLTFGLGSHEEPVDIEVRWPSGLVEMFESQAIKQTVTLTEGTGRGDESGR